MTYHRNAQTLDNITVLHSTDYISFEVIARGIVF